MAHKSIRRIGFILITLFVLSFAITQGQAAETLTLWARYAPEEAQPMLDAYNARLQAAGKSIQWAYQQVGYEEVATALAEDRAPDVVGFDLVQGPQLIASGLLLDLTEHFNSLDYRDSINHTMLNLGSDNGKIYAMPVIADVSVLVYNKTLFRAAGLDPDHALETWDDLRSAAQTLTKEGVVGYELWCGNGAWLMYTALPFAWANGGKLLSADGTEAMLDDPKTVEAVQFLADMRLIDHSATPIGTPEGCAEDDFDDSSPSFENGTLAIKPSSGVYAAYYTEAYPDLDFGVALFPGKSAGSQSSFIGGDLAAIPAQSTHPDEAWDLIQYLLSADVQVEGFAAGGYVPVRADLADNSFTDADPRFKVLAEALAVGDVPSTPIYIDLYAPLQVAMQAALNGDQPVAQALAAANAQMQHALDQR